MNSQETQTTTLTIEIRTTNQDKIDLQQRQELAMRGITTTIIIPDMTQALGHTQGEYRMTDITKTMTEGRDGQVDHRI